MANSERLLDFDPDLNEDFETRLRILTNELINTPSKRNRKIAIGHEIRKIENKIPDEEPLSGDQIRYLASLEVLLDLIEMDYGVKKDSPLKLLRPDLESLREDVERYKKHERNVLLNERNAQFQKDSIKRFIRNMETPEIHEGQEVSIRSLITQGEQLYQALEPLRELERDERTIRLKTVVDPYIQVVEPGERDAATGLPLRDIWRYFRYTWLTPYNSVPGRNIDLLIRNAAQPRDPVMGIASLGSPIINLSVRDNYIGWKTDALEKSLQRRKRDLEYEEQLPEEQRTNGTETRTVRRTEYLESKEEYQQRVADLCGHRRASLRKAIEEAIDEIRVEDLIAEFDSISNETLANPTDDTLDALSRIEATAKEKLDDPNYEDTNPDTIDNWVERSETPLFRRKRAETLRRLLQARRYFVKNAEQADRTFIETALQDESGKQALKTGFKEMKKERAGATMMNIMVCGAIPPYNEILGGKLVAMALTGPRIVELYRQKYADKISEIASSMKGAPVKKPSELVFLDTTSLFEVGAAQYDRIRVPATNGQITYEELGKTKGFGSIQFGRKTRKRLSQLTEFEEGQRVVKNRFGGGVSPRMRKLRQGMKNLGTDQGFLKHDSRRLVYGIELAKNAKEYLRGETESPDYYWDFNTDEEQASIYDHWRHRWVSKRITNDEVLSRLKEFDMCSDLLLSQYIHSH